MSTLAIVALTVLLVLILITLILALVACVYVHVLVRREISKLPSLIADLGATIISNRQAVETVLASNQSKIELLVASVNGQEITQAVHQLLAAIPGLTQTTTRVQQTFTLLEALAKDIGAETLHTDTLALQRARSSGLLPNAYAPDDGERGYTRSRVAAGDRAALEREGTDEGLEEEFDDALGGIGAGTGTGPDGSEDI